jgi:para-nitrobenzyl esterase
VSGGARAHAHPWAAILVAALACGTRGSSQRSPAPLPVVPVAGEPGPEHNPRVDTTEGRVIGTIDGDGVEAFLGVPFAAPPVGALRWREATPPLEHSPQSATAFALPCSQIPLPAAGDALSSGKKVPSSEDCLYLNVWVPPRDDSGPLPVMVWIHGGQYLRGSAAQYDGAQLARLGHVVVVTLAYRLGPMGFLAHPELTAQSPLHTSGNQALLDQVQALRWLQANLAGFGGDAQRVTLFGESAGSASTCALMASPLARGLFQRAILESNACATSDDTAMLADREAFGRRLAAALHCDGPDVAAELACMRTKTDDEVMTAVPLAKVLGEDGGGVGYRFNVDGVVLPRPPADALRDETITRMPVMLGSTENEMGRYVGAYGVATPADLQALFAKEWPAHAEELVARYPATASSVASQLEAAISDWAMTCPIRRDARAFARLGVATYLYRFRRAPGELGKQYGAFHGSELAYLFPSVFAPMGFTYTAEDRALAEVMTGYWARFAATGDPNDAADPMQWPRYDPSIEQHMSIDVVRTVGDHLRAPQCALWDSISG